MEYRGLAPAVSPTVVRGDAFDVGAHGVVVWLRCPPSLNTSGS
jgi:hypothetical protein